MKGGGFFSVVLAFIAAILVTFFATSHHYDHREELAAQTAQATINNLKEDQAQRDAEYEERISMLEDERGDLYGMIDSASTIIADYETKYQQAMEKDEQIQAAIQQLLTGEVKAMIEASPPLKEYVTALQKGYDDRGKTIDELRLEILQVKDVVGYQERQLLIGKEIESTLRKKIGDLQSLQAGTEKAFQQYRQSRKRSTLLGTVGAAAVGFLGGVVFH